MTQIDISQNKSVGYRIGADGAIYNDSAHTASDYLTVTPGAKYILLATDSGNSPLYVQLAFYTDQKTFISRPVMTYSDGWDNSAWTVTAPDNAAYLVVAAPTSTYNNALTLTVDDGGCFYE